MLFKKKIVEKSETEKLQDSLAEKLKGYDPNVSVAAKYDIKKIEHFQNTVELELKRLNVWDDINTK